MADVNTGAVRATRTGLRELLDALAPIAVDMGGAAAFGHAYDLVDVGGAIAQRRLAADEGIAALPRRLADRFLEPWPG